MLLLYKVLFVPHDVNMKHQLYSLNFSSRIKQLAQTQPNTLNLMIMPHRYSFPRVALVAAILLIGGSITPRLALATTPPNTPTNRAWALDDPFTLPRPILNQPRRDFQDIIGQFRQTCIFLDSMQEHNAEDASFGGLHEGEGDALWAIVESDNTQEAIRVWCEYGLYFNDPDRFSQNIEDAFTYLDSFPAWQESPPGEMYGIHNSGWGLIAVMAYQGLYGDSRNDYGRQCAELIIDSTPEIAVDNEDRLMPLVVGFGAGTLYLYGEAENNQEYKDAASRIATQVKNWIDHEPTRLHNNEVWALSGGTAFWGVVNSLGRADSSEIADWVFERSEQMDVFAGGGQWNNSWNIWYAHAWLSSFNLTGQGQFLENSITIVDSLVAQDGDDDGGIPATIGDPDNRDQAWVSAYTAWMGLRARFERLPEVDATLISLRSPRQSSPLPVGRPIQLSFVCQQRGLQLPLEVPLHITGAWDFDTTVDLTEWEPQIITLERSWTPEQPGETDFLAYFSHNEEADRSDDSLRIRLNVVPVGHLNVSLRGATEEPVGGQIVFFNLQWNAEVAPETLRVSEESGDAVINLIAGEYRVSVIPDFPYAERSLLSFNVPANQQTTLDLDFNHPPVLLIDADTLSGRSAYYENALTQVGAEFYSWQRNAHGEISNRAEGFQTLIYFTGNRTVETIPEADQTELAEFIEAGGSLFITGQNISEDLAGGSFLSDILHARHLTDNTRSALVVGADNDPILSGKRLLLLGNGGANNQNSPSGIAPLGDAVGAAFYSNRGDTAGAIRWITPNGGRGVFFSFGLEGVSGQGGMATRDEVMLATLTWLQTPLGIDHSDSPELPTAPFITALWPNPFNDRVTVQVNWGREQSGRVMIYDQTGRSVAELAPFSRSGYIWNGRDMNGLSAPAGIYFARLESRNGTVEAIKLVYLR